jgi:hypothetical protein
MSDQGALNCLDLEGGGAGLPAAWCDSWKFRKGKGREPQIILKTDERRIFLDLGLERKFTARSGAWDDTRSPL